MSETTLRDDGHADHGRVGDSSAALDGEPTGHRSPDEPLDTEHVLSYKAASVRVESAPGEVSQPHGDFAFAEDTAAAHPESSHRNDTGDHDGYDEYGEYDGYDEYGEYDDEYLTDGAPSRRNGLARVALVLGLIGLFPLGLLLGLIAVARRGRGKIVATLAIVVALAWTAGVVVFWPQIQGFVPRVEAFGTKFVSLVRSGAPTGVGGSGSPDGQTGNAYGAGVFTVQVGDCFDSVTGAGQGSNIAVAACGRPHEAQVFYRFDLPEGDYPDQDSIDNAAMAECRAQSGRVLDKHLLIPGTRLQAAFPQRIALAAGHRTVSCVVNVPGQLLTTSVMQP